MLSASSYLLLPSIHELPAVPDREAHPSLLRTGRQHRTKGPLVMARRRTARYAARSTSKMEIWYADIVKVTRYFEVIRQRPDRAIIRDEWIERAIRAPIRETVQADGRIRRWVQVPEMENRFLRVIILPDGETIHNAFFDRRFVP